MKHPPQSIPGASSYLPVSLNTLNNNSLLKKKVIAALCSAPLYPKHPSCCLTAFPTLEKHYTSCSVRGLPGMKNYNPNTCWMGQKPCSVSRCSVSRFFSMTKLLTLLPQCHTLNISRPADLCCFWLLFKHFWLEASEKKTSELFLCDIVQSMRTSGWMMIQVYSDMHEFWGFFFLEQIHKIVMTIASFCKLT